MPAVLATAFGPWGHHQLNASWEALSRIDPHLPLGWDLHTRHLPVAWHEAPKLLTQAIGEDTRIVLAFGQADTPAIRVERLAINTADRFAPDANNQHHSGETLIAGAPPAYFTNLPWQTLITELAAAGLPVEESHHAGSFLCNATFFHLMHHLASNRKHQVAMAGFVHVPQLSAMAADDIARAMALVINTSIASLVDSHPPGS